MVADIYRPDLSLQQARDEALRLQKEMNISWAKIKQKLGYPHSDKRLRFNVHKATALARDVLELLETMDPDETERVKIRKVGPIYKYRYTARMHTVYSLENGKLVSASWME